MQPQQQPYDFSVPQATPPDPASKVKKIIIYVGGGMMIFMIVLVIATLLLSKPGLGDEVGVIAAKTNEVARVADIAIKNERASLPTVNNASTSKSSSVTYVNQLISYVNANSSDSIPGSILNSATNTAADTRLEKAAGENNFDEEYKAVMTILINDVNSEIVTYAQTSDDQDLLNLFQIMLDGNQLLLEDLGV